MANNLHLRRDNLHFLAGLFADHGSLGAAAGAALVFIIKIVDDHLARQVLGDGLAPRFGSLVLRDVDTASLRTRNFQRRLDPLLRLVEQVHLPPVLFGELLAGLAEVQPPQDFELLGELLVGPPLIGKATLVLDDQIADQLMQLLHVGWQVMNIHVLHEV